MLNEYDYDEEVMRESIMGISVPQLSAPVVTPRTSPSIPDGIFFDLQLLIEEERLKEQKRVQQLKLRQQTIREQVSKRLADKDRKIRQLEQEQKQKVYAECTFKPKTTSKGSSRPFEQFLQQQQDHTKKIAKKNTTLKQNLEAQKDGKNTFQPKTNKRALHERKKEGTVFERLYALKDKENEDDSNSNCVPLETFQPTITEKSKKMNRNAPINELLYQDALRRQEKARGIESQNQSQHAQVQTRAPNLNNERYVAQKFIKEYYGVIERLNVPASTQDKIDYMLFNEILKDMGFVQVEEEGESSHERTLIHQAYQLLEDYQVNAKNICVFLLALLGVFHINPVNFQEGEPQCPEEELAFDEPEGRKLQRNFDLFKRNRLSSENSRNRVVPDLPAYSFKPQTNKASKKLAELHREQMLQEVNEILQMFPEVDFNIPKDGVISPTDLLVLYDKAKEVKLQCRKEELDELEMEHCTFKPTLQQTQGLYSSKFSTGDGSLGQKKSLELYNFHQSIQSKKESLRVSRQSEDSIMKECTFAPSLNRHKVQEDKSKYATKEVEENLYRMRKGRERYETKKKLLSRGEPSSMKKDPKHSQLMEQSCKNGEQTPILLLDVNLGHRVERLTLFSGDETCLELVAKQFASKHELDEESESRLVELLQLEMESILMKIPEDEESEDNQ